MNLRNYFNQEVLEDDVDDGLMQKIAESEEINYLVKIKLT